MKIDRQTLLSSIQRWMHLKNQMTMDDIVEHPIPAELFTVDQLEQYAVTLAKMHRLTKQSLPDILLGRLSDSEAILINSYNLLVEKNTYGFSPAMEWLIDNFYLIQEQIHVIRRNLPKEYGRSLPQISGGFPGCPRIYALALAIIEHSDGHWDLEQLSRFIIAYQDVTKLTLGELWAIPITLSLALIEYLSKVSKRIVTDRNDHKRANEWADRMIEVALSEPKKLVKIIAEMAQSEQSMSSALVSEFTRRLQAAALVLPFSWIEQHLAEDGLTIDQLVQEENKRQAANQVTVSNIISSLRRLGEVNWSEFVERMSIVEQILQTDPSATYSKMNFNTRDHYRHVVERLSRESQQSEHEVALCAIQLARTKAESMKSGNKANPETTRYGHVGYYLIGKGLPQLEKALGVHYSLLKKFSGFVRQQALLCYLASIILITSGLVYALLFKANQGDLSVAWLIVLGTVVAVYGSQIAVALVNQGATILVKPHRLPRMDFAKGIPDDCRTLVVVPAILGNAMGVELLIEGLEVRFLGNQDKHLHFMLLTDFNDAPKQHMPEDAALLNLAKKRIDALNERYSHEHRDIFFLCHRPREWNEYENVWMGKERKRGKLTDLNNLLRENIRASFSLIIGDTSVLDKIKYVITLDSDTQLPRDSARQFIGTMAHPLNWPILDIEKQCVVDGYGVLQPRMAEALPLSGSTPYLRICGTEFGVDPYTRTVSDVYQDLFHEGSFMGKGIYDVALFQQVLGKRFPNNRILSHDFLEGCYLRSGFLSDVPLYESTPTSYLADAKRRSRWIRGDWQIVGWLFPTVLNSDNRRIPNPISFLSKLKLFDNLRRSLAPVALMVLFGLNWTILPGAYAWLVNILALIVLPVLLKTLLELFRKPKDMRLSQHIVTTIQTAKRSAEQLIIFIVCLPHEAWYSLTAILRTCWRMLVSKRHLLEWSPSDQIIQSLADTPATWIAGMWMGPVAAVTSVVVLLMQGKIESLLFALPLLTLWFASPFIARWLSRTSPIEEPKLDSDQIRFLHKMARKTWGYFETFITAENHWLPPDNYQETPVEALARRTSPTNMGLSLLANLTAYDFGYINMSQLLNRTMNTLHTMNKLERYRGHLYNWYNTETLEPLVPRYISTVDSGNLAGHLLTLRQGLLALPDEFLLNVHYIDGLKDTYDVLAATVINSEPLTHFRKLLYDARQTFTNWSTSLTSCNDLCIAAEQVSALYKQSSTALSEASEWSNKLMLQCYALRDEISLYAKLPGLAANVTLRDIAKLPAKKSDLTAQASHRAKVQIELIETLAHQVFLLAQMDVSFLYDEESNLMRVGFNVDEQRLDISNYDLLSSEARLGYFVAIAQGQIRQESWFALGRFLVSNGEEPTLVSWSGSMFEYLMPLIVMPTYPGTLLDQTYQSAVYKQITYCKHHGVPWGISESGYNAVDAKLNYLYRAFGVPGLGLKRGLEDDLVIAPYASVMALMVAPESACLNLQRLESEYAVGKFGFYEAIDFTADRLPRDSKRVLVRSFMAHHQSMSLLSFSYLLHHQPMQRRFVSDPLFQATLLLLQERNPKPTAFYLTIPQTADRGAVSNQSGTSLRSFKSPSSYSPQVQMLSNGCYHLVITQAGGGYSRWKDIAVTRWREDSTCDNWGLFNYVRDVVTGEFRSTIYQPTPDFAEKFKAVFSEAHAEFRTIDMQLDIHTEIVVSPEDDIELRRVRIHNHTKIQRIIEFTSYAEIVLAPQATDLAQPAFSNLFVETELLREQQAILATRRSLDGQQSTPWLCHLLNVYSEHSYTMSFETDRWRFVGRGRTLAAPLAMIEQGELSNTMGAVLDPIVAIRCRVTLEPNALVTLDLLTGITDTREHCIALIEKYQDRQLANRIFGFAWTHGQVLLHHLNISKENVQLYERLASAIIYTNNTYRAEQHVLASNKHGQSSLWVYSISGDIPIVLLTIENASNIELVQQLIQAQAYWRHKGLTVDLVILNEEPIGYLGLLQDKIMSLISGNKLSDHSTNIVACIAEQMPLEDRILLQSVARVILSDKQGTLKEQLNRRLVNHPLMPLLNVGKLSRNVVIPKLAALPEDLQFFNGIGGFTNTGDEYFIQISEGVQTPAPWVNVLANSNFGTLISESGQGYTWTENSHEFRLTPWDNDPLKDSAGEAFYLRDEETGLVWSPTALPSRGRGDYQTRHGFGYSVFEHVEDGIYSELWMYVALDAPVKFMVLKIHNNSSQRRWLSATGYVAWVLGDLRTKNSMHVMTELTQSGALLAQNRYNTEFGDRTAFFDAVTSHSGLTARTVTGDRTEFIGRNGSLTQPAALKRKRLSGRIGAGFDPCGAIQLAFHLAEGQSREIVFTLGVGKDRENADILVQRYHDPSTAQAALTSIRQYWQHTLHRVRVSTPDPSINLLANGWLLYQVLSSRLWGRTGYYQSSGAFGFRDQLQDVMSLTNIAPQLFREQILLCAAHQFEEGDVQHWWHPPHNRGVRTRCSDDYLWLSFAICHYIESTGDNDVLEEKIPFLQGRPLNADEESYYDLPIMGTVGVSLYQHAVRAIQNALKFGKHGLPLMGSGDWNDGMNLVGKEGRGESVWLGFFLYTVLKRFAPIALRYGDNEFATRCDLESRKLLKQLETHGWDGEWYRRAYFDDGTPLGSYSNSECQIDSIAQSWSVLSGAADPSRAKKAMASLYAHLVSEEDGLIKLLDPPFNTFNPNPGYIQGYVPGIRENGGQYTHAAVWAVMAFAQLGDTKLAWKLLNMINPINHGRTPAEITRYKIEPYVVAGDVYSTSPHIGRGGWSWYTGSAGWLYRLITETLLGVKLVDGKYLHLTPILPANWDGFSLDYNYGNTVYKITVNRVEGESSILLDEVVLDEYVITLVDDEQSHHVNLNLNAAGES